MKKFIFDININDYTIVYEPSTRLYYIGLIKSNCYYYHYYDKKKTYEKFKIQNTTLANLRDIKWIKKVRRDDLKSNTKKFLAKSSYVMNVIDKYQEDIFNKSFEIDYKNNNTGYIQNFKNINTITNKENYTNSNEVKNLENKKSKIDTQNESDLTKTKNKIYKEYLQTKSLELIKEKIKNLNENQLKKLISGLLHAMNYKTTVLSDLNNEINIIASPDGLGLKNPVVKVKVDYYKSKIISNDIKNFKKILNNSDRGMYVSINGFTKEAKNETEKSGIPIILIDLDRLTEIILENYDDFDYNTKKLLPLTKVYWPI